MLDGEYYQAFPNGGGANGHGKNEQGKARDVKAYSAGARD